MTVFVVIISLAVLILAHEIGHFAAAKFFNVRVEEFGFGYPPRLLSRKIGETTYSLNLLPLGGFVHIAGEDEEAERGAAVEKGETHVTDVSRSFGKQAVWKRVVILSAGVVMNVLAGWLVFSAVFMVGSPSHLIISEVAPNSPASVAGVRTNDIIAGAEIGGAVFSEPIANEAFVTAVKKAAGTVITLDLMRGDTPLTLQVTSRKNPPAGQGAMGISLDEIGIPKVSFFAAVGKGFVASMEVFWDTAQGFYTVIKGLMNTPSDALRGVAGPVGIFSIAAQTGKLGFVYLFQLVALISLNLAVLNFIPFPALDGGRILFILIEKLKGSPVPLRVQQIVNAVGFAALMVLMIIVTAHDIGKIIH